ncbi:hypothetical protein [Catellatospora sichuanensis]|uniref:hypothetical protein n=1 Tax=Catellatospora sichuanensis TaxID=1969805 RepID=UPI001182B907|nr:hypothetical protein [Catellatospora sichuanensis]
MWVGKKRPLRALAAKAVVVLAASTGLTAVMAGPAQATCGHEAYNGPTIQYESVTGAPSGVHFRFGPHVNCTSFGTLANGHQLEMMCYDQGDTVNGVHTWSWVRKNSGSGNYYGWVSDYYLTNRGSKDPC